MRIRRLELVEESVLPVSM